MKYDSYATPARVFASGIGQAVADRTIARLKEDGTRESWADVAHRVATGNSLLEPRGWVFGSQEFEAMHHHLRQASILMSGRHLQHGDAEQPTRNQEVFTNCSTAATNFVSFYLLLNGSGVGRSYDDSMMLVDYRNQPQVLVTISKDHPDVLSGEIDFASDVSELAVPTEKKIQIFNVPDSREGWAKTLELIEVAAFENRRDEILILDFSGVRARGEPIRGMQNRPASGPAPMMRAIQNIAALRDKDYAPWLSAMHADHYIAECVLVGGARRAARMATKTWRDKSVLDFINVKKGGVLWSSNNSVTVDEEFWRYVRAGEAEFAEYDNETLVLATHAKQVFEALCIASYFDGTGEPGLINVDRLAWNDEGVEVLLDGDFAESGRFKVDPETLKLTSALALAWDECKYKAITNPCGEIVLGALGGYCVIADVVPFHAGTVDKGGPGLKYLADWDDDAEDAFRVATRALIRTNLMDCLYGKEVKRTNRIGVGITGLHEYAWARFAFGWKDLVDEKKSIKFWLTLSRFKRAIQSEAALYSRAIGVSVPHTNSTMKPAGTTSKLFALTEGAHLPSMRRFIRWVQFRNDDPLIETYRAQGYPVRELVTYSGTTIVGFPTSPTICDMGMGFKLVTAAEATPEEQYEYLRLLEKYWIVGVEEDGVTPLEDRGNQVSYTLKYDPTKVSFEDFKRTLLEGQSSIRCCSVMPQADTSAYEYQPEEPVSDQLYDDIVAGIHSSLKEEVGFEHVDCGTGGCPVDWVSKEEAQLTA